MVQSSPFQAMELGIPTVNQSVLEENQETVRIDPNIFRSITWQAVSNSHGVYPQSYLYNTSSILTRVSRSKISSGSRLIKYHPVTIIIRS